MKKNLPLLLLCLTACSAFLTGCLKDKCTSTYHYKYYLPVYKTTAEVRANIRSNAPRNIERPGKIYIRGQYIFLNEIDKGIHVIDNANPGNPVNKAFIDIPGNMDLAVKGNTLYADLFTDMVAIDISDPLNVSVAKVLEGVFPYRYYGNFVPDSSLVIADWQERDTVVTEDCNGANPQAWPVPGVFIDYAAADSKSNSTSTSVSPFGLGGSMARFAVVGDRLYTVGQSELNVFNIGNPAQPSFTKKTDMAWGIETIYPFKNHLFIGSNAGMFVFSVHNPDNPEQIGQFSHVVSCDPVIADDDFAYVTLRSGTACRGISNELDVLRLNAIVDPTLVKTYPFTNPQGLAKDGNLLFVCDGADGLKVFNATDPTNMQSLSTVTGLETYDVIALGGVALVVAKDGLYQYSYANPSNLTLLSKLTILN